MAVTEYWKGCGPDCCRCHCDCEQVQEFNRRYAEQMAALTPQQWEDIDRRATEMLRWFKEMAGDD